MKRLSFLAVLFVALFSLNSAKAQVGVHVGLNIGSPAYYAPAPRPYYEPERVVVVHHRPAYYGPRGYYGRPVYMRHGYYGPRRVVVVNRGYYHRRHGMYRRW